MGTFLEIKRALQELMIAALAFVIGIFVLTQILHGISLLTGFAQVTVGHTFVFVIPLIGFVWIATVLELFHRIAFLLPGFVIATLIPILDDLAGRRDPFFMEIFVPWYGTWWGQLALIIGASITIGVWLNRIVNKY